jgi:hypothetical protein
MTKALQRAVVVSLLAMAPWALGSIFDPTLTVGEHRLYRAGQGELRRFMIKGCDVAFYTARGVTLKDALSHAPRGLVLHYVYPIRADQFARAAWKTLERALKPDDLEALRPRIEALHNAYRDVERGDRYRLTYTPAEGTALELNGKHLITVPGADFARAYFGIWLGEHPINAKLRKALLADLPAGNTGTP